MTGGWVLVVWFAFSPPVAWTADNPRDCERIYREQAPLRRERREWMAACLTDAQYTRLFPLVEAAERGGPAQ